MNDTITIEDLELWTRIGMSGEERQTEQRLLVTVEMRLKQSGPHDDDLQKSVEYASVTDRIRFLASAEHRTIEFFAEEIAALVLKEKNAESVVVRVRKFALPGVRSVMVTMERPSC